MAVEVRSEGEDVVLQVGNWSRRFSFEVATALSMQMDECARVARHWEGRRQRLLQANGTLHDANDDRYLTRGQPFHVLPQVNKDMLRLEQIDVRPRKGEIALEIAGATLGLPWQAALTISQWVRLRAKESQARAGDKRHWSKVAQEALA